MKAQRQLRDVCWLWYPCTMVLLFGGCHVVTGTLDSSILRDAYGGTSLESVYSLANLYKSLQVELALAPNSVGPATRPAAEPAGERPSKSVSDEEIAGYNADAMALLTSSAKRRKGKDLVAKVGEAAGVPKGLTGQELGPVLGRPPRPTGPSLLTLPATPLLGLRDRAFVPPRVPFQTIFEPRRSPTSTACGLLQQAGIRHPLCQGVLSSVRRQGATKLVLRRPCRGTLRDR